MTDPTARHSFGRINGQCPVPQTGRPGKNRSRAKPVNQIVYQTVEFDSGAAQLNRPTWALQQDSPTANPVPQA
jgi:hypothetical protein